MEHLTDKFDFFIFDWDGVLIRLYTHVRLYGRIISFIKKKRTPKVYYDKNFDKAEEITSKENYLISLVLNFFVEHLSRPHLNDYVVNTLEKLKKRNKKIYVLTNGNKGRVLKKMHKAGIEKYFYAVVSAKDINAAKPNPKGLKLIIKMAHADPKKCLYIGDKTTDIITAKYAKISSCGIADGFDSYERLKYVNPDFLFKSMKEFYYAL
ncbi:MAG: HAD family hydrolase [Candidatus Micrarchaeia archaeon]